MARILMTAVAVAALSAAARPVPNAALQALKGFGELRKLVQTATTESGETDTARWMTGVEQEKKAATT